MSTVDSIEASKLQQRKEKHMFNMKLLPLFIIVIVLNGVFGRPQNLDDDYDIDLKCFEYRSEGYRYVEQRQ